MQVWSLAFNFKPVKVPHEIITQEVKRANSVYHCAKCKLQLGGLWRIHVSVSKSVLSLGIGGTSGPGPLVLKSCNLGPTASLIQLPNQAEISHNNLG